MTSVLIHMTYTCTLPESHPVMRTYFPSAGKCFANLLLKIIAARITKKRQLVNPKAPEVRYRRAAMATPKESMQVDEDIFAY